jgi:hypothetical protein
MPSQISLGDCRLTAAAAADATMLDSHFRPEKGRRSVHAFLGCPEGKEGGNLILGMCVNESKHYPNASMSQGAAEKKERYDARHSYFD